MKSVFLFCAGLLSVAGCVQKTGDRFPEIQLGKDSCARCGMIISEARYASGYFNSLGETVAFDDLGEAFEAVQKDPSLLPKMYVAGLDDLKWIRMSSAHFVLAKGLATPMGSGVAAFVTAEQAGDFARQRGSSAKNFDETLALLKGGKNKI